jgi:site-specific DNA recombinase
MNYLVARVSDPQQREALPAQEKNLRKYASEKNWIEGKDFVYIEFDETAYKDTRKQFKEKVMQPLLDETEPCIVVFDKIDRFTRDSSSEERQVLTKLFRTGKIELHFPGDNLFVHQHSPASDLFRLDIGVALAGYYSSAIRDNVKRRFNQKLADGEWPGKAPIGYINYIKGYDAKNDPIKHIMADPARAAFITKGFELRSTGVSYEHIAKQMKKEGLRSNTKLQKPITRGQWEEILKNPFYYGKMRYDGKIYVHHYGAIVQPWIWDRCQEVREQRTVQHTKYGGKQFLFKNLRCATCGYTISTDRKKNKYNLMKCTEYGGKHGAKIVNENTLIEQIMEVFASFQVPEDLLPTIIAEIETNHESEQKHYLANKKRLQREYDAVDTEISDLFRDRKMFANHPERFETMVRELEVKQKDFAQQMADHAEGDKNFVIGATYIVDLAARGATLFAAESTKLEQKRYLINLVLSNAKLDGKSLSFNLEKPFDILVGLSKSSTWLRGLDSNQRPSG